MALFISVLMIFLTNSIVSFTIPWTCKIQGKTEIHFSLNMDIDWLLVILDVTTLSLTLPADNNAWCRRLEPCRKTCGSLHRFKE